MFLKGTGASETAAGYGLQEAWRRITSLPDWADALRHWFRRRLPISRSQLGVQLLRADHSVALLTLDEDLHSQRREQTAPTTAPSVMRLQTYMSTLPGCIVSRGQLQRSRQSHGRMRNAIWNKRSLKIRPLVMLARFGWEIYLALDGGLLSLLYVYQRRG
jgi:hypothetical protein